MKIGIRVGDVMTRNFIKAKPNIPLLLAVRLMVKKHIGSLILVKNGELRGILTEKDVMWAISKKQDLRDVKACDICTKKIITIKPSADIYDAIVLMKKNKLRRLPVVLKKKVIGYMTLKDILAIQPELFEIARDGYNISWPKDDGVGDSKVKEGICERCKRSNYLYLEESGEMICDDCRLKESIESEDEIDGLEE